MPHYGLQTLAGKDYAIFFHEMGEDGFQRLEKWESSEHPFDQWFAGILNDCYDMDNLPELPEFVGRFK